MHIVVGRNVMIVHIMLFTLTDDDTTMHTLTNDATMHTVERKFMIILILNTVINTVADHNMMMLLQQCIILWVAACEL